MNGYKLEISLLSKQSKCTVLGATTYHLSQSSVDGEIKRFKNEWLTPRYTLFVDIKEIKINE